MGKCKGKQLVLGLLLLCAAMLPLQSRADDSGLIVSAEASHKIKKGLNVDFGTEFRSRNHFRTADRVSFGASISYKVLPWLKASGGYDLLIDNNHEKITYQDDGVSYNNWRPSYWGVRHRFNVTLTGSYKVQRVELSLRERWQYTYRPSKAACRWSGTSPSSSLTPMPVWSSTPHASWRRRVLSSAWNIPSRRPTNSSSITVARP